MILQGELNSTELKEMIKQGLKRGKCDIKIGDFLPFTSWTSLNAELGVIPMYFTLEN